MVQIEGSVKLPMKKGFGKTDRRDDWWKGPTAMAAYLGFMIIYATWRGFMESDFLFFSNFGASSCENWDAAKSFKDVSECQTMSILLILFLNKAVARLTLALICLVMSNCPL